MVLKTWLKDNEEIKSPYENIGPEDQTRFMSLKKNYRKLSTPGAAKPLERAAEHQELEQKESNQPQPGSDQKIYDEISEGFFKTFIIQKQIESLVALQSQSPEDMEKRIIELNYLIHLQEDILTKFARAVDKKTWNEKQLKFFTNARIAVTVVVLISIGILSAGLIPAVAGAVAGLGIALAAFVKSTIGIAVLAGTPVVAAAIAGFAALQDIQKEQRKREDLVLKLFGTEPAKVAPQPAPAAPLLPERPNTKKDGDRQQAKPEDLSIPIHSMRETLKKAKGKVKEADKELREEKKKRK